MDQPWIYLDADPRNRGFHDQRRWRDRQHAISWERFPLRHLPVALFLMPFMMHAAMLPVVTCDFNKLLVR
jgi:hypothetical protein